MNLKELYIESNSLDESKNEFKNYREYEEKRILETELKSLFLFDFNHNKREKEFIKYSKSDLIKDLNLFFKERFNIKENVEHLFEQVVSEILNKDFYFLDYGDIM